MVYVISLNGDYDLMLDPPDEESATVQDLYILLNTAIGECPMYREFGIDKEYLHMPVNVAKTMLTSAITDAIEEFMPELDVEDLEFHIDGLYPDTFQVKIEVVVDE
jgi:phage baseplate assembly protein W